MPLGIDFAQILLHLLNVVILFGGLYLLLYSPVKKFIKKREDYYRGLDEQAKEKLEDAEKSKAEYQEKISNLGSELAEKRTKAEDELEKYRLDKKAAAEKEAAEILASAEKKAEAEKESIISGAREELTNIIEEATKKVTLDDNIDTAYDTFFAEAERSIKDEGNKA